MQKSNSSGSAGEARSFSSVSSDKVLLILEFLTSQSRPMRLQEIADALSMTSPTALRYLNSLVKMNYIVKDEDTLRYTPTYKVCQLSHHVLSQISIRDIASPYLKELSGALNCNASVSEVQDNELIYLDVVYLPQYAMGSIQRIGKNAPLHSTGSGKLFLASMTEENLMRFVREKGLPALTRQTITTVPRLKEELEQIRNAGYAIDNEECEDGFRCISAPLFNYTDRLAAAISVFSTVYEFNMEIIEDRVVPLLRKTADKISVQLGASGPHAIRG